MRRYLVKFETELDFKSLGVPDEMIQEAFQAIRLGVPTPPGITISNAREENGIIRFDAEMTVEARDANDAIAYVKSYIVSGVGEPMPDHRVYNFKAQEI